MYRKIYMNQNYKDFSLVYDELMSDVDYKKLCALALKLCKKHNHTPRLVLDAGCGTGSFALELTKKGIDVIGVDASFDMLSVAREKLGASVTLICQTLQDLDLYGTIDTCFCMLDTFNHITDYDQLQKALCKISLFLEPNGLLIFDVNTVYKHKEVLGNNIFTEQTDDIYMVWQNSLRKDGVSVNIVLNFFVADENDRYIRLQESFDERAYTQEQLHSLLENAGFEVVQTCDFSGGEVEKTSEKIIYVARNSAKTL